MTAILYSGKKAMATATATKIKKEPQVEKKNGTSKHEILSSIIKG